MLEISHNLLYNFSKGETLSRQRVRIMFIRKVTYLTT